MQKYPTCLLKSLSCWEGFLPKIPSCKDIHACDQKTLRIYYLQDWASQRAKQEASIGPSPRLLKFNSGDGCRGKCLWYEAAGKMLYEGLLGSEHPVEGGSWGSRGSRAAVRWEGKRVDKAC